ncbi:MAG TPA: thioredoxin family protein [Candidatus Dormibacteraeota bacterium]|jgi:hypothetical protein|nr:thioredoxin family protein [Candidatus Dormibacteraeota bacterium]
MERLIVLAVLAALVAAGVIAVRWWAGHREAELGEVPAETVWSELDAEADGRWGVVSFSTAFCGECRVQDRILDQLANARVLHVDAAERPAVARRFGVMTVPSTLVLDPVGRVRAVNHGLADLPRLRTQILAGEPTALPATR